MMEIINKVRDKTRGKLHRFSHLLGEVESVRPESLHERQKARETVTVDIPQFKSLLPYEAVDGEGFFHNRKTAGFGFIVSPMCGADETLVQSLSELFKNKLPRGAFCTVMLFKHQHLGANLVRNYLPFIHQGGIVEALARRSMDFHIKASKEGYPNHRNIPAKLADYQCHVFVSIKKQGGYEAKLSSLRDDWASELKVSGFYFEEMGRDDFRVLLNTLVSPDLEASFWPEMDEPEGLLSENIANPTTVYEYDDARIDVSLQTKEGEGREARLVSCEVLQSGYPKDSFGLWQTPDLFASLLKPEHGIHCPFLMSFTIEGGDIEKTKALAKSRAKSLNANTNAVQTFLSPGMVDQAKESNYVHEESAKDNLVLTNTFYNLLLFTNRQQEKEHVAKAISSFRQQGFSLIQSRCSQWLRFLASLPFTLGEGLFDAFRLMGMTKEMTQHNVANFLPVVSDFKGGTEGVLIPTYRHQAFYLNCFDDRHLPLENYNRLIKAASGSGKSYFQATQILDSVSRGHQVFIIDIGDSYKHLCEILGGSYVDATSLSLNPFTLFDFNGEVEHFSGESETGETTRKNYKQISDLIAIMANPDEALDGVQKEWVNKAVLYAWKTYGKEATIDSVLEGLELEMKLERNIGDRRLSDLLTLLEKYSTRGVYGDIFNSPTAVMNNNRLVVLELGGLSDDKELMKIVMFAMICVIQGQFYQGDRRQRKECIIDEGWQYLVKGSNKICANFIEHGYRVCRKYNGSFALITQTMDDTEESIQGRAINACSAIKIIMKQGGFKEYIAKNPERFNPLQQRVIGDFGEARTQGFSNLMVELSGQYSFHRLFSDPFSRILFSTTGDEFGEVEALAREGVPLIDAIDRVAQKYYGGKA